MVFGKDVRVEWKKRDKYKRIVGKVWVQLADRPTCPTTLDAGHAQITVGLAWWYRKYANEQSPQDRGAYEFSEREARAKRVGLWSELDPVPPWEWRRSSMGTQQPKNRGMINAGSSNVEPLYGLNIRGIVGRPDDQ